MKFIGHQQHISTWRSGVPPLLSVRHDSHMQSHQLLRLTLKILLDEIWTFRHINIGIYSPALSVETQEPLEISSHLRWYNFSESYAISKVCLSLKTLWYTHKHVRVPDKTSDLNSFKTWLLKPFLDTVLYAKGNWSRIDRSTWFSTFGSIVRKRFDLVPLPQQSLFWHSLHCAST